MKKTIFGLATTAILILGGGCKNNVDYMDITHHIAATETEHVRTGRFEATGYYYRYETRIDYQYEWSDELQQEVRVPYDVSEWVQYDTMITDEYATVTWITDNTGEDDSDTQRYTISFNSPNFPSPSTYFSVYKVGSRYYYNNSGKQAIDVDGSLEKDFKINNWIYLSSTDYAPYISDISFEKY